jgi:hypothetical protein
MSWQTATRAGIMAVSSAVIVGVGGPALVRSAVRPPLPAQHVAPVADAGAPAGRLTGLARSSEPATPSVVVPVPTRLTIGLLARPRTVRGKARFTVHGILRSAVDDSPAAGRVTLWRKTPNGTWKAILARRPTAPDGSVDLLVEQSGRRAVYRMTVTASPVFRATTSADLVVRRR